MNNLLINNLIQELEKQQLTKNEQLMLQVLKMLALNRVFDTSSVLFDVKTDIKYFWLRLNKLEDKVFEN
ncbi:hypothetical protein [Halalkalibacter alkaliphilus]|uniref:Uncharacterized protein n=1 Tax=Halalkalibacter alkaliphilus TaxID=2917993 RepID=A0A9X2CRV1_9BACI|nr:hypothetical protein [Halalkalibacter alkaliphilus]MCL7747043.1 hypothetical protein [Halalkalibacter alkaliphilus]